MKINNPVEKYKEKKSKDYVEILYKATGQKLNEPLNINLFPKEYENEFGYYKFEISDRFLLTCNFTPKIVAKHIELNINFPEL